MNPNLKVQEHEAGKSNLVESSKLKLSVPSLTEIYEEHAEFVWQTLHRLGLSSSDLEDGSQEVFTVIHLRLSSYDPAYEMRGWIYGICIKVAAKLKRKVFRTREVLVPEHSQTEEASGLSPEQDYMVQERKHELLSALEKLSTEHREAFILYELEERSCEEIAALMCVSKGTIHSRLYYARKTLAKTCAHLLSDEALAVLQESPKFMHAENGGSE